MLCFTLNCTCEIDLLLGNPSFVNFVGYPYQELQSLGCFIKQDPMSVDEEHFLFSGLSLVRLAILS